MRSEAKHEQDEKCGAAALQHCTHNFSKQRIKKTLDMFIIDKKTTILLMAGLPFASPFKVKMYATVTDPAKFTVRCVDGSQPVIGDLDYALADAYVSMNENTEGWRSASDCSDCFYGMCGCESCSTRCGGNQAFSTTHQPICTNDDAAVLCTGSRCSGGLRAIGTAECGNGALELQVESSKLIINTPTDVWIWASLTVSDDVINVQDITGWVLSSGKEFHVGGGALVIGGANDDKVGKCCDEEGKTIYGNPPVCESSEVNGDGDGVSGDDGVSGGAIGGSVLPAMLLLIAWTAAAF